MVVTRGAAGLPTRVNGGPNNIDAAWWNLIHSKILAAPTLSKVQIEYSDFTADATSEDIEVFSLSAKEFITEVRAKQSTAFAGPSITALTLSAGITGDLTKFLSAFDVFQAVSDAARSREANAGQWPESFSGTTSLRIAANSTGANLSALTAGVCDFWIWTVTLP